MNVAIFLDDVTEFNGPLMFIPGSHRKGVHRREARRHHHQLPALDGRPRPDHATGQRAGGKHGGIVSPKGPAGSMILFHCCLVHASSSNLSPFEPGERVPEPVRGEQPHPRASSGPEYIAHRDFTPIACLPDDCLLKDYAVELPWKGGMPASALQTSLEELAALA